MKALVGAFNQEKALVGAFSVIVKTDCETNGSFYSTSYHGHIPGAVWDHHNHRPAIGHVVTSQPHGELELNSPH